MSDKDKDGLLGLFSTRSTQHRPIDTSRLLPNNGGADGAPVASGTQTPTSRATSTPDTSASVVRSGPKPSTATHTPKSQLGALANTIMREARRELGSDVNLQQAERAGIAVSEQNIADAVDKVLRRRGEALDDIERANVIIHLQKDLLGWGVLQPLIDNREVTDIHVYDWQTVVLQRGKVSETTGIHWPNHQAYVAFLDRLLLRLGKSLSTQQHTVDASFPNGIRICVVHESVCGARGPLLCIRVPRIMEVSLESLVNYQVAPPLIVNYLGSIVRSGLATFMIAGETGTGKTTLLKCLGTQFGPDESIVAVEDTPEVNIQHPYFRSLVSRPPNVEGVGEVTLQEHIKTTLRMTPTRVILGEMRTPFSAEAFLESAQTGHVGMSTIHARNARETLVRLESLLGRAQKSVAIDIIRQQIALAVDVVIWLHREKSTGKPRVGEIIEVGHFVEGTIQIRPMFTQSKQGENPLWRVESWTSGFEEVLNADGMRLGEAPPEVGFGTQINDSARRGNR
jgi:pilus assembly protein CpaF